MVGLFGKNDGTKCKKCGTELHDPERLKRHQEKAHGDKKNICEECGQEFLSSDNLKKHKKKCK